MRDKFRLNCLRSAKSSSSGKITPRDQPLEGSGAIVEHGFLAGGEVRDPGKALGPPNHLLANLLQSNVVFGTSDAEEIFPHNVLFLGMGDKISFGGDQKGITGSKNLDFGNNFFQPLQGDIRGDDAPELFGAIFSHTIHGHRIRAHYDIAAAFVIIRLAPFRLV